ncbi:MAG: cytochrome C [Saprospirales bacterium]|nr:cytochrome C [Saprospirales bacterium]
MKYIFSFLIFATLIYACSSSNAENSASASASKKAEDGEKIYKTYCVTCHGIYGDMGSSGAFDLTISQLTLEERIKVISEGRNLMTPFKELLSEEKIKAVAEYIETLRTDK